MFNSLFYRTLESVSTFNTPIETVIIYSNVSKNELLGSVMLFASLKADKYVGLESIPAVNAELNEL